MPRYFFNIRSALGVVLDPEGDEITDLEAARRHAIENARDAMSRAMLRGHDISRRYVIEIAEEDGTILLDVPYLDAILPDET